MSGAPKRLLAPDGLPESTLVSRDEAQALIARTLKSSKADTCRVTVTSNHTGNTRFAANQMATSGGVTDANVVVQSSFGPKHAIVTTNDLSDESIQRVVAQSEALARLAPDDPESMPELNAQQYTSVNAYFDSTASLSPGDRAKAALTALEPARNAKDLAAAGFIVTSANSTAIGNNNGMFAYFQSTSANYHAHGAHRRRHRIGLGRGGSSRLGAARLPRGERAGDRESAAVAQPGGHRAGTVHRHPRAASGR